MNPLYLFKQDVFVFKLFDAASISGGGAVLSCKLAKSSFEKNAAEDEWRVTRGVRRIKRIILMKIGANTSENRESIPRHNTDAATLNPKPNFPIILISPLLQRLFFLGNSAKGCNFIFQHLPMVKS
jgi:hypothetical protein